jgi:hypothetical protein
MTTRARTLLQDLIVDVEQLITAGAESASGHERLLQHAQRLEKLSLQVPALNRFLPLIHRVVSAERHEAAGELLNLVIQTRRLRASLAESSEPSGELQPIADGPTWSSETPMPQLISEIGKLYRNGYYRSCIKLGSVPPPTSDLRMIGRILGWIETGRFRLANSLIEEVIPTLGPTIKNELARKAFDTSELGDMHRLVALAKLDAKLALEAIEQLDPELGEYLNSEPEPEVQRKTKRRKAN